jgi:YVTN family beta-propeller protein
MRGSRVLVPGISAAIVAMLGLTYAAAEAGAPVGSEPEVVTGRIYVANEGSTSVSVFDAATNALVTTICLGSDRQDDLPGTPGQALADAGSPCDAEADHHKPFYDGHLGTHGLWLTPNGAVLLVTNRISGTVVAIDTRTNAVLGYAPTGREPHLATVHPGGREAWVAVRGERYLDVLKLDGDDLVKPGLRPTDRMDRKKPIDTMALGPSMVSFTSDGQFAFVAAGKQSLVEKINGIDHSSVASAPVLAPFTPFGLVTPDDAEVYLIHKNVGGIGKLSILRATDLGLAVPPIDVGGCANHVAFVGKLAYITAGGPPPCAPLPQGSDPTLHQGKLVVVDRTSHIVVRELTGPIWTGDPHGIWASPPRPDGQQRLYVGHESGNRVTVVNTWDPDDAFDDSVETVLTEPQLKQPIDVVFKP